MCYENHQIIASGEEIPMGSQNQRAKVAVWNLKYFTVRAWFSLEAEESCRVLRITKDGLKIIVLSEGAKGFRVTLYDWVNRNIEASSLCGNYRIRDIKIKDAVQFVTVGIRHIQFWKFNEGELSSVPGDWAKA